MADGQLGEVVEGGDQLAGVGVGLDFAGQLDDDAELGVLDHHVEGDQGVEGVVVGLGDEERALEGLSSSSGGSASIDADLRGLRAALARARRSTSRVPRPLRADLEPFGLGGVGVIPSGRVTTAFFMSDCGDPVGVADAGRRGRRG